jgi:hypothetical protein
LMAPAWELLGGGRQGCGEEARQADGLRTERQVKRNGADIVGDARGETA